jgi:hypothetical protein
LSFVPPKFAREALKMSADNPLHNLAWNEAVLPHNTPIKAGMIALLVIKADLIPQLVGSGFLITAHGDHATAITAAHCFEGIRAILHPNAKHHLTTPQDFLGPPGVLDLQSVKAIYLKDDGTCNTCDVEMGIWDSGKDFATFKIVAPKDQPNLFRDMFMLASDAPAVGEGVAMIGYKMGIEQNADDPSQGQITLELLQRIGIVEELFPEKHFLLKGPAMQTSIAVFSGMSGGLAAKWSVDAPTIQPFGLISHAPEPQPSDPKISGHSVVSMPPLKITKLGDKIQSVELRVDNIGVGEDSRVTVHTAPFDFKETKE